MQKKWNEIIGLGLLQRRMTSLFEVYDFASWGAYQLSHVSQSSMVIMWGLEARHQTLSIGPKIYRLDLITKWIRTVSLLLTYGQQPATWTIPQNSQYFQFGWRPTSITQSAGVSVTAWTREEAMAVMTFSSVLTWRGETLVNVYVSDPRKNNGIMTWYSCLQFQGRGISQ